MEPSEIRAVKEAFLRALYYSILLAILTNMLSFFWVIGGEAWFGNFYTAQIPEDFDNVRSYANMLTPSRGGPIPTVHQETVSKTDG
jgi:hypothetical protein